MKTSTTPVESHTMPAFAWLRANCLRPVKYFFFWFYLGTAVQAITERYILRSFYHSAMWLCIYLDVETSREIRSIRTSVYIYQAFSQTKLVRVVTNWRNYANSGLSRGDLHGCPSISKYTRASLKNRGTFEHRFYEHIYRASDISMRVIASLFWF